VISVSASAENFRGDQQPVNTSVTVTLNRSLNASFLNTTLGDDSDDNIDSIDENNTEITIFVGPDGEALVFLETTENESTVDAVKTATLDENTAVTDSSNVTFVGVTTLREASISGIVTDSDDDRLPGSAVFAQRFELEPGAGNPDRIRIRPDTTASQGTTAYANAVDNLSDEFIVELRTYNTTAGSYETAESATVSASELQSYDFSDFPSLNVSGVESFKLYQIASPGDATYTLDPVPAVDGTDNPTDYRIRAVKTDTPFIGQVSNDALPSVFPATTDDANVVIPYDEISPSSRRREGGYFCLLQERRHALSPESGWARPVSHSIEFRRMYRRIRFNS